MSYQLKSSMVVGALLLVTFALLSCSPKHSLKDAGAGKQVKPPAEFVSYESYLRKASLHVRGRVPGSEEYASLAAAEKTGEAKPFLLRKLREYLDSIQHIEKMSFRMEELFRLTSAKELWTPGGGKKPPPPQNGIAFDDSYQKYIRHNSLNELFRRISQRNLSWDQLLLNKSYMVYPRSGVGFDAGVQDNQFFGLIKPDLKKYSGPTWVEFSENDSRIAGAITTSRFSTRYVNTAVNKNRRRAAAIFGIFLCDNMAAAVESELGNQDEVLDLVFPAETNVSGNEVMLQLDDSAHGARADCMKCHYKLDPMGKAFSTMGISLSPFSSPGQLVYKRKGGEKVQVDVAGLGDLAKAIVRQPEYAQCQVKHFWNWFIGEDVPLSEGRLQQLVGLFDDEDRRTNDFIYQLLQQPEFGWVSENDDSVAGKAKAVLRNCNSCHRNEGIPSFSDWPIGGSGEQHTRWVKKIALSLDVDGQGSNRDMPPAESLWQPSKKDLATLEEWIEGGAQYE